MVKNYVKLTLYPDTLEKYKACKELYIKHHPEVQRMFLSQDYCLNKIFDFYLES